MRSGLGLARRHPLRVETQAKQSDDGEQQPHDPEQMLDTALKLQHSCTQCLFVLAEKLRRHNRSGATSNPTCRRGAGDPQLGHESGVALLANELTQAMVVGSAAGAVHRPGMARPGY